MKEKVLSEKTIYKGRILDLLLKEARLPNGRVTTREIIDHGDVIMVAPILDNGKMIMVRQYRLAAQKITLELPAGRMDSGETPIESVHRELKEETGYIAKKLEKFISFYPAIGYSTEKIHFFSARNLTQKDPDPDEDEFIDVIKLSLPQALKKINSGEIVDSKSILGILYLAQYKIIS